MLVVLKRHLKKLWLEIDELIERRLELVRRTLSGILPELDNNPDGVCQQALEKIISTYQKADLKWNSDPIPQTNQALGVLIREQQATKLRDMIADAKKIQRKIQIIEGALIASTITQQPLDQLFQELNQALQQSQILNNYQLGVSQEFLAQCNQSLYAIRESQPILLLDIDQTLILENAGYSYNDPLLTACEKLGWLWGFGLTTFEGWGLYETPAKRKNSGPTRYELLRHIETQHPKLQVQGIITSLDMIYRLRSNRPLGALYKDHYQPVDELILKQQSAVTLLPKVLEHDDDLIRHAEDHQIIPCRTLEPQKVIPFKGNNYSELRKVYPEKNRLCIFIDDKAHYHDELASRHQELGYAKDCLFNFDPLKQKQAIAKSVDEYCSEFKMAMLDHLRTQYQQSNFHLVIAQIFRHEARLWFALSAQDREISNMLFQSISAYAKKNSGACIDLIMHLELDRLWTQNNLSPIITAAIKNGLVQIEQLTARTELFVFMMSGMHRFIQEIDFSKANLNSLRFAAFNRGPVKSTDSFKQVIKNYNDSMKLLTKLGTPELDEEKCITNIELIFSSLKAIQKVLSEYCREFDKSRHPAAEILLSTMTELLNWELFLHEEPKLDRMSRNSMTTPFM